MDLPRRAREAGGNHAYLEVINISGLASSVIRFLFGQRDGIQRLEGEGWNFFQEGFFRWSPVEGTCSFSPLMDISHTERAHLCSLGGGGCAILRPELSEGLILRVILLVTLG